MNMSLVNDERRRCLYSISSCTLAVAAVECFLCRWIGAGSMVLMYSDWFKEPSDGFRTTRSTVRTGLKLSESSHGYIRYLPDGAYRR